MRRELLTDENQFWTARLFIRRQFGAYEHTKLKLTQLFKIAFLIRKQDVPDGKCKFDCGFRGLLKC